MISLSFSDKLPGSLRPLVIGVGETGDLSAYDKFLDERARVAIEKLIKKEIFKPSLGKTFCLHAIEGVETLVLLGLGKPEKASAQDFREAGGQLAALLEAKEIQDPFIVLKGLEDDALLDIAMGVSLRMWRFQTYKRKPKVLCEAATFWSDDGAHVSTRFQKLSVVAESVLWARQLVNEPANRLGTQGMLDAMYEMESLGLRCEALDENKMRELGMGALLGVAMGSEQPPYLGIVHWKGGAVGEAPLAFVGKGVMFDSGGLSLKPSSGMEEMKADMGGAACVLGTMRALALMKAPVNAVGVVALVENMVSGKAQRPGDIVKSLSGLTIEVLNTDAEGRLILADALTYTEKEFKPAVIIDVATLTGALRHALGPEYAGLFTRDDVLAQNFIEAGQKSGEKLWRLPLCDAFGTAMESPYADLQNIAPPRYGAGSSTAAAFLERFVTQTPWVHVDIANQDMVYGDMPLVAKGGEAFGIRLFCQWVADKVAKK